MSNTDVEKQAAASAAQPEGSAPLAPATTASTRDAREESDASASAEEKERSQDPVPRSTTFAAMEPPSYRGAGTDLEAAPTARTFSRRQGSRSESAHPFGGDLSAQREEIKLERFQSQAGKDQVIVHWEGENDSENPQNFSNAYKVYLTVIAATLVLNSTFTSSAPSGIIPNMTAAFGLNESEAISSISLWVAGYCFGPLIFGPLSERLGRRPIFLISIFVYTVWNVACALSQNTAQLLVFRFLGGVFGSAPLTNSGGVIADIWDAKRRGIALSWFSVAPFAGPALGPIVSGAINVTGTDWRWVFWVCAMFSGACFVITYFTVKETYAPKIIKVKAQRIRKETGNNKYRSPLELSPLELKSLVHDTIAFPFIMLVQEPILLVLGLFLSFVYGLIYLQFESYPIVFQEIHGFNALQNGLCFLPLFLGGVAGCIFYIALFNPRYVRLVDEAIAKGTNRVPPEERLLIVCIAAPCLVISFFWIGWTAREDISYWSPMMAGSLLGFAVLLIFLGLFSYIVDSYLSKAASALAGNTVMRSAFGAGFPLFANAMYKKLGVDWASSLLGFLALLMLPSPFLLYKYGPKIRALSKHAT